MRRPAIMFYPGDWQRDAALRSCSVAARGLWLEMICIMHQAEPYGHLVVNGQPIQPRVLARMVGATVKEVDRWIAELEAAGVFDRDGETIVSRRMVRDERVRRLRAEGGKLGGNPALKDNRKDGAKVGNKVNLPPNLRPTPSVSSSSSGTPSPYKSPFRTAEDAARFARWYAHYPVRKAKGQAEKAWVRINPNDKLTDRMIEATKKQRAERDRLAAEGRFVPEWKHPATWLNARAWEDESAPQDNQASDSGLCECGALGVVKVGGRWRCNEHREAA